ncbi:MAG: hypothetical protein V3V08_22245 [Nannocystaceae bacterium]
MSRVKRRSTPSNTPISPDLFPSILGVPMREPMYFGTSTDGLVELGRLMADDPRFSLCAAKRFYGYFHQLATDEVPLHIAASLQKLLYDTGMDAKALARAIVLGEDFRVSHVVTDQGDGRMDRVGYKKLRPIQMGQLIRELTGFEWATDLTSLDDDPNLPYGLGAPNLLEDSFFGYNVLAGGIDAIFVTRPSHTYSATSSLVLRTLAGHAARKVVDEDFDQPAAQRWLLHLVEVNTDDEGTIREQLAALHLRLYGERHPSEDAALDSTWALWRAAFAHSSDISRAWKTTLSAMLQDVRIAYY